MAGTEPARIGRIAVEAARRADVRVVLITGWGGIAAEAEAGRVLVLEQAPHDWLFPRMAAVVHHGGGGTTAAALTSGRPQVVCPFVADQPYWGRRMHASGVAPEPVPQRRLTADSLGDALRQAVSDPAMRTRAAELGKVIREENGAGNAVAVIEQHAMQPN
jgi:sterol 3beta-glucosyltransferase